MNNSFFSPPKKAFPQEDETINVQNAFWTAIIFSVIGLAFFVYSILIVVKQQGRFDLSDTILMPVAAMMLVVSLYSIWLVRRGRHALGTGLLFFAVTLIPPIALVLSLKGVVFVSILYIILLSSVLIGGVLPRSIRRYTITASLITILLSIAVELWNPSFRINTGIGNFATLVTTLAAVVLLAFLIRLAWSTITYSISNRLTTLILVVTIPLLIGITAYISLRARTEIETQALHNLQQNNQSLATNVSTWLELHARAIKEMAMLPDIISMDASRQVPTLLAIADTHPNLFLVQTTDLNGLNIARNDDAKLNDYHDRVWFLGAKGGAPITFEALISRTIGKPALNMASPIYNESGKIVGVASIVSELSEISKEVLSNEKGQGITYIVDANNRVVAHPDPSYTEGELRDLSAYPPITALNEGKTGQITFTDETGIVWIAYINRLDNGWGIVAQQPEAELLAPVRQFQTVSIFLIIIGSAGMFALAWFVIRRSLQPISALTMTVSAIAAGDLSRNAEVTSTDEIGLLASTFNEMTAKLRESFTSLEQRVADRTRNLELAAEVGRAVSQVRTLDVMLTDAAELIRKQFDLYYVQVYLTNPSQAVLILQAGTGTVGTELLGRAHRLPLNTASINGRAAIEKQSIVISDTTSSATFKPNPLLPDTRSEMAVPLLIGETVVGVLDMQSREANKLNKEGVSAFEALAGQLAIAIQNATLLAQTEQARAEVEAQARRQSRSNWNDYLDAIHKPEETGFVFEKNQIAPMSLKEQSHLQINEHTLSAPIEVIGESLGSLTVEMEGRSPIFRTEELINTVARQIAQQIESLRLLESAERYRSVAEEASRLITHEGWQDYKQKNAEEGISYIYDLNEVKPYHRNGSQQPETAEYTLPLKVRDETIGKLVVQGIDKKNSEDLELVNAVAERLGAHLEGLRLSNQTEQALLTTQKLAEREQALRQITSAVRGSTDPATILRSAARELGTILGRKTIVRLTTAREAQPSQQQSIEANKSEPVLPVESHESNGDN